MIEGIGRRKMRGEWVVRMEMKRTSRVLGLLSCFSSLSTSERILPLQCIGVRLSPKGEYALATATIHSGYQCKAVYTLWEKFDCDSFHTSKTLIVWVQQCQINCSFWCRLLANTQSPKINSQWTFADVFVNISREFFAVLPLTFLFWLNFIFGLWTWFTFSQRLHPQTTWNSHIATNRRLV